MIRLTSGLLLCFLLFLSPHVRAQNKLAETEYYPLRVGTTWHYKSGDGKIIVRVVKHEKVGDVLCARLETTRDGKVVGTEHLAVTDEGVYRHDLTQPDANGKMVTHTPKPPIRVLKLPPKKGDNWKVDTDLAHGRFNIDESEVKVPAGTYQTIRVRSEDLEINGLKPTFTWHYAKNIGMVKQVMQEGNVTVEIVLEKFEAGK